MQEGSSAGPGIGGHIDANTGPKVTISAIEENIHSASFIYGDLIYKPNHRDPLGEDASKLSLHTLTVCMVVLQNGFTVIGTSSCADPANYNKEIGQKIAYQNCINQIWPLMGYELKCRLDRQKNQTTKELDEALTRLTAHRLGNPEAFRTSDAEAILATFEDRNGDTA